MRRATKLDLKQRGLPENETGSERSSALRLINRQRVFLIAALGLGSFVAGSIHRRQHRSIATSRSSARRMRNTVTTCSR